VQQATKALLSWAERRGVPAGLSDEDFIIALLERGYATDKNYLKKVKRFL
jgi:flagellum-specific peptidoglycan hydrolase FlgJ